MNKLELPKDKELAGKVLQAQSDQETKKIERGFMGRLFGMATEKPGNIAGFVILTSLFAIVLIIVAMPDGASVTKRDAIGGFVGLITLSLGYIFGKSHKD